MISEPPPVVVHPTDPAILAAAFVNHPGSSAEVHASTIADTPFGLVAAWFGGTKEGNADVGIWLARRLPDGRWSAAVEVADGVQSDGTRLPAWNPVLFQPRDGPLMLFYKVGSNVPVWWGELKTSADGGATWSPARRLPRGIFGPIKNKPVQLADGALLCPSSDETNGWSVHFERSEDLGVTWQKSAPVNDGATIQAIQPSILDLGDGRLLALGRTRQDRVFETTSADHGRTWTPMTLGSLPNNNSGTDAVTLADGSHLIVYNHAAGTPGEWSGPRTPLNLATSADGRRWHMRLVLEDEPGEYSYPAVIQARDGLVHVTYTWRRLHIKHLVIDPAALLTPAPSGSCADDTRRATLP